MNTVPVPDRCNAVMPLATGDSDDLHCERLAHRAGRHRDVDLLWLGNDPDTVITVDELLEATDHNVTDHPRSECCAQAAAFDQNRLAGWLAANMPDTLNDGERPVDTAIRVLALFQLVAVTTTRSVVGHIVVPLVDALRHAGIDILPDGVTIPPATAVKESP